MSMIEKFLSEKDELYKRIDEMREEMQKAAFAKGDAMVDEFAKKFEAMIAGASNEEFINFITSGKLEDEEINFAIMCRAKARKPDNETESEHDEVSKVPVHVVVLGI